MKVAEAFSAASLDEVRAMLDGGTLTVYSVARPLSADLPVDRSGILAVFTFAAPAFGEPDGEFEAPRFVEDAVAAQTVGTPGFARARTADGTVVADFSAGPGAREIKFAEVSCSVGAPVRVASFSFMAEESWPERPDYYATHPRPGFAMPPRP